MQSARRRCERLDGLCVERLLLCFLSLYLEFGSLMSSFWVTLSSVLSALCILTLWICLGWFFGDWLRFSDALPAEEVQSENVHKLVCVRYCLTSLNLIGIVWYLGGKNVQSTNVLPLWNFHCRRTSLVSLLHTVVLGSSMRRSSQLQWFSTAETSLSAF